MERSAGGAQTEGVNVVLPARLEVGNPTGSNSMVWQGGRRRVTKEAGWPPAFRPGDATPSHVGEQPAGLAGWSTLGYLGRSLLKRPLASGIRCSAHNHRYVKLRFVSTQY